MEWRFQYAGCFSFAGFWLGNIISAILFSLIHLLNSSYTSPILFLYAFTLGLLSGCMRKVTGTIWMGIGYHFAWNYLQSLFSIPETGTVVFVSTGAVILANFVVLFLFAIRKSASKVLHTGILEK